MFNVVFKFGAERMKRKINRNSVTKFSQITFFLFCHILSNQCRRFNDEEITSLIGTKDRLLVNLFYVLFFFFIYQDSVNNDGPPVPTHRQVWCLTIVEGALSIFIEVLCFNQLFQPPQCSVENNEDIVQNQKGFEPFHTKTVGKLFCWETSVKSSSIFWCWNCR